MHSAFSNKTKVFTGKRVIEKKTLRLAGPPPMGAGHRGFLQDLSQPAHPCPVGRSPAGVSENTGPALPLSLSNVFLQKSGDRHTLPHRPALGGKGHEQARGWGRSGLPQQMGSAGLCRERRRRLRAPRSTAWRHYLCYHGLHHSLLTGG